MEHPTHSVKASREWLDRMARAEDEAGSISVGGLASESGMLNSEVVEANHVLAHLIELARRERGLSYEELAHRADLQVLEVLALEHMHSPRPSTRVVVQCARALELPEKALVQLMEMPTSVSSELLQEAIRFMSSSEGSKELSREERTALTAFRGALVSGSAE